MGREHRFIHILIYLFLFNDLFWLLLYLILHIIIIIFSCSRMFSVKHDRSTAVSMLCWRLNSFSELHATANKFENAVLFLGLGLSFKLSFPKTLLTETTFESERKTSLKTELFESEFPVRIFFKSKSKITGYCSFLTNFSDVVQDG